MNGSAKINSRAIATPMMGIASSKPATMNIFVCSVCRAALAGEPSLPGTCRRGNAKPIAVPSRAEADEQTRGNHGKAS